MRPHRSTSQPCAGTSSICSQTTNSTAWPASRSESSPTSPTRQRPTDMDVDRHIEAIEEAGDLMATAASRCSLDARVPTCPDWDMRELVRHQGGVHRWATGIVTTPRIEPWNVDLPEVVGSWPDDDDLLLWLGAGCHALAEALRSAPGDLACWAFLDAPS